MICPNCKKEISDKSRFCGYCGAEIPQVVFCGKCGAEYAPGSRFCGRCGAALSAVANTSAQNTADLASALAARREKLTTMRQELEQRTARLVEKQNALAAEAEKQRLAREAEERRKAEEEARLAREAEEAARKAEEERLAQEAEERRKAEEEARLLEEKRRAEEAARKAEEERLAREAEEQRKAEEEARLLEEKRKAEEAARKAEEERLAREAEERREAEEDKALIAVETPKKRKKTPLILGIAAAGVAAAVGLCAVLGVFGEKSASTPKPETAEEPEPEAEAEIVTPDVAVGDHFCYGTYEQDGDLSNGPEPVEWRILTREGDKVLVISEYAIASHEMDSNTQAGEITWETCECRSWLNNELLSGLFTEEEQQKVLLSSVTADVDEQDQWVTQGNDTQDKLFLLSTKELNTYFTSPEERTCYWTIAQKQPGESFQDYYADYPSRTRRLLSFSEEQVEPTLYFAHVHNSDTYITDPGEKLFDVPATQLSKIRPAMWLDLSNNNLLSAVPENADRVCALAKKEPSWDTIPSDKYVQENVYIVMPFDDNYVLTNGDVYDPASDILCGPIYMGRDKSSGIMYAYLDGEPFYDFECRTNDSSMGTAVKTGDGSAVLLTEGTPPENYHCGLLSVIITIRGKDYSYTWDIV